MRRFEIEYEDPETQERKTEIVEFEDAPGFPARMWAEDCAYSLADKGYYKIKDLGEV